MSKKNKIAIFFGDMTEEGQKRVATQGLTEISEYSDYAPDQIEVESITVDDACRWLSDFIRQGDFQEIYIETY